MNTKNEWLSPPVMLHSSRAFNCEGFDTAEQCEYYQYRWHFWYVADWVFALPTVAFFMCSIGVFIISHLTRQILAYRRSRGPPVWQQIVAGSRYLSYRGFRIEAFRWNSAPVGLLLLAALGTLFFFCMTLIPQPYYWPGPDAVWGNSPPLGTRSGWMALACMPFVFATASKANWITLLTGFSHERLQVFHRWISYAFFILALMHTFPFIVYHVQNHDMVMQFTMDNYFTYWTGVVALLFQAWLTFASHSWIRNFSYEFFKATHFVAVILFILIFFWHCGGALTSWDYFIATAAVYVPCLVYPWLRTIFEYGIGRRAQLAIESNDFVRISVPANFHWVPGQHCFLRFHTFGLHAYSSHPFTICSLPSSSLDEQSHIVFYIRPHGGFTRRLYDYAKMHGTPSVPLLVDGPYGGIDDTKYWSSDRLLVIAGGSGAGWSLPLIEQFYRSCTRPALSKEKSSRTRLSGTDVSTQNEACTTSDTTGTQSLRMIFATRDSATRVWFNKAVNDLVSGYAQSSTATAFNVEIHLTSKAEQNAGGSEVLLNSKGSGSFSASQPDSITPDKCGGELKTQLGGNIPSQELIGRPNLPFLIREEASRARKNGQSLGIFVCGPETMQHDVRNAVAMENLNVLKASNVRGEIYLYLEHFSWA